jgi:hypothetical protein
MNTDFFNLTSRVLAPDGLTCVFCRQISTGKVAQKFFSTIEEAAEYASQQDADRYDAYFACMRFVEGSANRVFKNAIGYKSINVDIDCGAGKKYSNKQEGKEGLIRFVTNRSLPMPTVVDSGNGYHCYWTFDEVVDYNAWSYLADAFVRTAQLDGFAIDSGCTIDGARVLRIPNMRNHKDAQNPKRVRLVILADDVSIDVLKAKLEYKAADSFKLNAPTDSVDEATMALINRGEFKFAKIMRRSLREEEATETVEVRVVNPDGTEETKTKKNKVMRSAGCGQLAFIYNNPDDIKEPFWRAALSIAAHCNDSEDAIVKISQRYSAYNPYETEKKAALTRKPQLCSTFQRESPYPELCATCAWKSKIRCPISLGRDIAAALPMDNVVEDIKHQTLNKKVTITIPITYPHPWYRPKQGGVALKTASVQPEQIEGQDEGEIDDNVLVYGNDIWLQGREIDPDVGEVARVARILPLEGLKEFTIPLAKLTSKADCVKELAFHGVAMGTDRQITLMRQYLVAWLDMLQGPGGVEARMARTQYGWVDDYTKFIMGNREITQDGEVIFCPSSAATRSVNPMYTSQGTLEEWKRVANTYGNLGNEARAFVLFLSMGSPFYEFLGVGSSIVHLTNSASGVGKSTAQMLASSVWGHPKDTMMNDNDTPASMHHRAGTLRNMIVAIDEITNIAPEAASDFAYRWSHNRGKNRMYAHVNAERENKTQWYTIALTSGNNSLYDTLTSHKAYSEGEMLRILEVLITKDTHLNKQESDELFHRVLMRNYGMVGESIMRHAVPNLRAIQLELEEIQVAFDKAAGMSDNAQQLRFYSGIFAIAFLGASLGKRLGLHDIPIAPVWKWAIQTLKDTRKVTTEKSTAKPTDVIGQFLNQMVRSTLIINSKRINDLPAQAIMMPQGELIVRYEPDTKLIYISMAYLQTWCTKKRVTFAPLKQLLENSGVLDNTKRYNLAKGTSLPGSAIGVLTVKADKLNVSDIYTIDEPS